MAYKPHEYPAKTSTIDRHEQSRQNKINSLKPVKAGNPKLNTVGLKKG